MFVPLLISIVLFPIIYYVIKFISKKRGKEKVNKGMVLLITFAIVNILWILAFIASLFIDSGVGGEVAFFFIGIPLLIIVLGLFIAG